MFGKSLKFIFFFRTFSKNNSTFYQNLSDDVVECVFYVSIGKLRRKCSSGKSFKFSILLRSLTGKNSVFRQAFCGTVEESAFYVSIGILWWERFSKELFSVNFGQRANIFRLQEQHSTGPEKPFNGVVSWKKCNFFITFVYWAISFSFLS